MAAASAEQSNRWSNFWTLCRIEPSADGAGYLNQPLSSPQTFFQQGDFQSSTALEGSEQSVAIQLLHAFRTPKSSELKALEPKMQALSGLCLRCWVSHPILLTCMKLANLFGAAGQFSYRDLLPFVLTDDGRQLVITDEESGSYQPLKQTNQTADSSNKQAVQLSFISFSLTVIKTYRLASNHRLSLTNWACLQTKQHPELTRYLAEFGFQKLSDWALLNRAREGQLKQLAERDRSIVKAFHAVYRRDRRQQAQSGKCQNPTAEQLQEMNALLPQLAIASNDLLLRSLQQIAMQLRQFNVWQSREPLEKFDAIAGHYRPRTDLPAAHTESVDEEKMAEQALMATLHQHLSAALTESLQQVLTARIAKLRKSKKYRPFAENFSVGLAAYYREGLSLKEITPLLNTSSWDQTRRILNPGDLLNTVRSITLQTFSSNVLSTIEAQSLAPWPPTPDYLQQLMEQLEHFADSELFQAAVAEMKAGSHRNLNSTYAQQLLLCLDKV